MPSPYKYDQKCVTYQRVNKSLNEHAVIIKAKKVDNAKNYITIKH